MKTTTKEQWKLIKDVGTIARFYISNQGNIKRVSYNLQTRKTTEKIVTGYLDLFGVRAWKAVSTRKKYGEHVHKTLYVHKLVAQYFIPNPNNYKRVKFKDGDKLNCKVSNLQWTYEMPSIIDRMKPKPVQAVSIKGKKYKFNTISEASLKLRILQSKISMCLGTENKYTSGYFFQEI